MKIECMKESLEAAVQDVARFVNGRPSLPITSCILISTDGGRLKLQVTDLTASVTRWTPAKVEEEGACAVDAKMLTEWLRFAANDLLTIETVADATAVSIRCGKAKATMPSLDPQDFPPITHDLKDAAEVTIEPGVLQRGVDRVAFAAAKDEVRVQLRGVHIEINGETATLVAVDGFRMAVEEFPAVNPDIQKIEATIPAPQLVQAVRLVAKTEQPIRLVVAPSRVAIIGENAAVTIQTYTEKYPDWRQFIREVHAASLKVPTAELVAALRGVKVVARTVDEIVRLVVEQEGGAAHLRLSSSAKDGGNADAEVEVELTGTPGKVGLNGAFLTEALLAMGTEEAILHLGKDEFGHVILNPVEEASRYFTLITPMFTKWE